MLDIREIFSASRSPGEVVTIPPGIYDIHSGERIRAAQSGTPERPLTYRAEYPGTVRIHDSVRSMEPLLEVTGSSLKIENLDFVGRHELAPGRADYRPQLVSVLHCADVCMSDCNLYGIQGYDSETTIDGRGDALYVEGVDGMTIYNCWITATIVASRRIVPDILCGDGISLRGGTKFSVVNCRIDDAAHAAINIADASGSVVGTTIRNRLGHGIAQFSRGPGQLTVIGGAIYEAGLWPADSLNGPRYALKFAHRSDVDVTSCYVARCDYALSLLAGDRTAHQELANVRIMGCNLDGEVHLGRFIEKDGSIEPQLTNIQLRGNAIKRLVLDGNGSLDVLNRWLSDHPDTIFVDSNLLHAESTYIDRHTSTGTHQIGDAENLNELGGFTRNRDA